MRYRLFILIISSKSNNIILILFIIQALPNISLCYRITSKLTILISVVSAYVSQLYHILVSIVVIFGLEHSIESFPFRV